MVPLLRQEKAYCVLSCTYHQFCLSVIIVFTAAHSHTPYGVLFIILSQLWDLSNYVAPVGDGFHTNIAPNRKIPQEIALSGDSVVCEA